MALRNKDLDISIFIATKASLFLGPVSIQNLEIIYKCVYIHLGVYRHTHIRMYMCLLLYLPIYINNHEFIPISLIVVQCHGLFPLVFLFPCKEACFPLTAVYLLICSVSLYIANLLATDGQIFPAGHADCSLSSSCVHPKGMGRRMKEKGGGERSSS